MPTDSLLSAPWTDTTSQVQTKTPEYKIYALKGDEKWSKFVSSSLRNGVGRFGWSGCEDGDLYVLKAKIDRSGWNSLNSDEQACFQSFLLDFAAGDWVIYVNLPEWGKCTMALVTGAYFWEKSGADFNHCFPVDPSTVQIFDRNEDAVHPALSQRLKLRGRYWRIYAQSEFETLRRNLADPSHTRQRRTPQSSAALLSRDIEPFLSQITQRIQRTHPNYDLEALLERVFQGMPNVRKVTKQGGAGDKGADLLVEYESGLPIPLLQTQHTCLVQVKSFTGEHWDTKAVEDIRSAFASYPNADIGLIVSTAEASTPALDAAIEDLRTDTGRRVELLIGADVARMLLRFGAAILG